MTIASLNMRGRYSDNGTTDKWRDINQLMRESKINILTLQEAHLKQEDVDSLHNLFGTRLKILFSQGANHRTAGVATVINKDRSMHENIEEYEMIPGRALLVQTPWQGDLLLTVLNIYAPNNHTESKTFFKELKLKFETKTYPLPDIMMGDFNIVEDAIDRLPAHGDHEGATQALYNLRSLLGLKDGWRQYNGNDKGYTYLQKANDIHSRIDRIYATTKILQTSNEWNISTSPINTDHSLVSTKIANLSLPEQGHGWWQMPMFLLRDREFQEKAKKLAKELENNINNIDKRTHLVNPQILHKEFKTKIKDLAIRRAKQAVPKMDKTIRQLESELRKTWNAPDKNELEKMTLAGTIQDQIEKLKRKRFQQAKTTIKAHFDREGEQTTKFWSNLNKENKPRDPVYSLKIPKSNPPEYTKNPTKMADIGRQHHHDLLSEGLHDDVHEREEAIKAVLEEIDNDSKLPDVEKTKLGKQINEELITIALKHSANGASPRCDGIPYKFWKMLAGDLGYQLKKEKESAAEDSEQPNITKTLTNVYLDIENHGVHPDSAFAEGWMCPLYKKKDKHKIENYHPITLLNTDYKIYTKALSIKLAEVAHHAIHPNQAGFMPGRSIFDQVKLARMMINYAEVTEKNGFIVALDQEKAYDKITHDYLWRTLEKYNLHGNFIRTV